MSARVRAGQVAAAVLLAGPTAIAFFTGGFLDQPRLWAGLVAWALVIVGALAGVLPRGRAPWVALAGLSGLAIWTWLSIGWAPLAGPAEADAQRVALYAGALLASLLLLGALPRAVEPALAAGCLVVIAYALAARLLPGIVQESSSRTAFGRLEQPLTYWNALGLLAAMGLVLAVRLAGDLGRGLALRCAGAAATAPLLVGLTLTFSRGAILAAAVALAVLGWLAPTRAQMRALGACVAAAVPAIAAALLLGGVRALEGSGAQRRRDGLVMLAILLVTMAVAALLARRPVSEGRLRRPRLAGLAVAAAVLLGGLGLTLAAGGQSSTPKTGADPSRLASANSNRYAYWRVAAHEFAAAPLKGAGSGAFRVDWRRRRTISEAVLDAHSLYFETPAELGLVGLGLLALLLLGSASVAWAAYRRSAAAAAGPVAALAAWALHAGVDWDWEMPAVTLVALLLLAALSSSGRSERPAG